MYGIVMCSDASITANNSGNWLLIGMIKKSSWVFTIGYPVYATVNGTSGNTISQTAPVGSNDVIQVLGVATATDTIYFNPSLVQAQLV
jgi:hypothetical protein